MSDEYDPSIPEGRARLRMGNPETDGPFVNPTSNPNPRVVLTRQGVKVGNPYYRAEPAPAQQAQATKHAASMRDFGRARYEASPEFQRLLINGKVPEAQKPEPTIDDKLEALFKARGLS